MKNTLKRTITLLSLGAVLSSCGGGKDPSNIIYSHPEVLTDAGVYPIINDQYKGQVKIGMYGCNNSGIDIDWANNKFFKRFSEATGVNFSFTVINNGGYNEKKSLLLSSGKDLPDIFFKGGLDNYDEVAYGGTRLRPLNDLIDNYAPHIKALLDGNKVIRKSITTPDGNIYSLPTIYTNLPDGNTTNMRGFFWINKEWMGDTPLPTTPQELRNILVSFRNNQLSGRADNGAYPLVISQMTDLVKLFNFYGLDMSSFMVQADSTGKLFFVPTCDTFKEALTFIRGLVKDKLMNSNWASLDADTINSRGSSGDYYGCFIQAAPQYVVGFNKMKQYVTLDPISKDGQDRFWYASAPVQRGCFALTYNCQYPEAAIRMMDALYDIEQPFGLWSTIGKEGEEWTWTDETKTAWKSTVSDNNYAEVMKTTIIQTGDGMPFAVDESFFGKQVTLNDTYTRPLRNRQIGFGRPSFPDIYIKKEDGTKMDKRTSIISTYVERFISDSLSLSGSELKWSDSKYDTEWENFKNNISRSQIDDYLCVLQERYDDFMNATK